MADRSNHEAAVRHLLQQQADHLTIPPPDPRGVHARQPLSVAADKGSTTRRNRLALLGVTAAMAIVVAGAAIWWSTPGTVTEGPADAAAGADPQFDFDTAVGVRLQAAELTVDVNDRTFSPTGPDIDVDGDPGWPPSPGQSGYTTLELQWFEDGIEMRVYLYFAADDTDWWVTEIRTYDGADPAEWITMTGEYLRSPLGRPFVGDLDAGPLHIGDMRLEAFEARATMCDGSGAVGELILVLSGARPVEGAAGNGYGTMVEVLDASTCEPVEPDGVEFRAAVVDATIADPVSGVLGFGDLGAEFGNIRVDVDFNGAGETILTVSAADLSTGDVLATLDIPVTVTTDAEPPTAEPLTPAYGG